MPQFLAKEKAIEAKFDYRKFLSVLLNFCSVKVVLSSLKMLCGVCQVVFAQAAVLLSYVSGKQARFHVINFIKIVMMRHGVRVSCVPFCARARAVIGFRLHLCI
jgi:hypothetical protein